MAKPRKSTETQQFFGKFEDFIFPEFENITTKLIQEKVTIKWATSGLVESVQDRYKLFFNTNQSNFSPLMKEKVLGVLGFRGLPFDYSSKSYFISSDFGETPKMLETLKGVAVALKEVDDIVNDAKINSGPKFQQDAKKNNNLLETADLIIEYDPENKKCYVVLKSRGDLFNVFVKAAEKKKKEIAGINEIVKEKVKDIPSYKNKAYLKEYVRSPCFVINEDSYSLVSEIIDALKLKEEKERRKLEKWLSVPENQKRVNDVLIDENNNFNLKITYDTRRGAFAFQCPTFECSQISLPSGIQTLNTRVTFNDMLLFNEILCRPEKEKDINERREHNWVAEHDGKDLWKNEIGVGKVTLKKRPDSKAKVFYLSVEENIEELEDVKSNYEKVKDKWIKPAQTLIFNDFFGGVYNINEKYPTLYLDDKNLKAYILHDFKFLENELGVSTSQLSCNALEITKKEFDQIYANEGVYQGSFSKQAVSNFNNFTNNLSFKGANFDIVAQKANIQQLFLSWEMNSAIQNVRVESNDPIKEEEDSNQRAKYFKI